MYQGSTTEMDKEIKDKFGPASGTVYQLAKRIPHDKYYHIFCDNYFTSPLLLKELFALGIYCTGTIHSTRTGLLPGMSEKELKKHVRGTSYEVVDSSGTIVITKWLDSCVVKIASTAVGIGVPDTCKHWKKETKEFITVQRPQCVHDYNESMGGVNKMDFLISLYRTRIRSRKWTLRAIFHFMDLAVCNAWQEYRNQCMYNNLPVRQRLDLMAFRIQIAEALIGVGSSEKREAAHPQHLQ